MARVYNFSAGPSMLPEEVLKTAQQEMLEYGKSGQSVMEMSHRSSVYDAIIVQTEAALRRVLNIPDNYKVGFIQGGASMQFDMIPINFMTTGEADYVVTGQFSKKAADEGKKYGTVNVIANGKESNFTLIPDVDKLIYSPNASYVHICENNTIFGTRFEKLPAPPANIPLIADMSSCILSRPTDVSKYGVIYFGVQKNVAPAGMAVVIIREDLLGKADEKTGAMLNYKTLIDENSMYNTPPTYTIYMMGLVLKWIENEIGGLEKMEERNNKKAALLYDYLDSQEFYKAPVDKSNRSIMNVTFTGPNEDLDKKFCKEAEAAGFVNLKGHRSVGGMRASIYNAMPLEGVEKLVDFMRIFAAENA